VHQDPVRARLSPGIGRYRASRCARVPRLPLNRPVVASQTSQGGNRLVPAAAAICLPIAATAVQQPLPRPGRQCERRLGIMLPSPGDQQKRRLSLTRRRVPQSRRDQLSSKRDSAARIEHHHLAAAPACAYEISPIRCRHRLPRRGRLVLPAESSLSIARQGSADTGPTTRVCPASICRSMSASTPRAQLDQPLARFSRHGPLGSSPVISNSQAPQRRSVTATAA